MYNDLLITHVESYTFVLKQTENLFHIRAADSDKAAGTHVSRVTLEVRHSSRCGPGEGHKAALYKPDSADNTLLCRFEEQGVCGILGNFHDFGQEEL